MTLEEYSEGGNLSTEIHDGKEKKSNSVFSSYFKVDKNETLVREKKVIQF